MVSFWTSVRPEKKAEMFEKIMPATPKRRKEGMMYII